MMISEFENLVKRDKTISNDSEREFWTGIKDKPNPSYANDNPGSLFDDTQTLFNLNDLNTFFDSVCRSKKYEWTGVKNLYGALLKFNDTIIYPIYSLP